MKKLNWCHKMHALLFIFSWKEKLTKNEHFNSLIKMKLLTSLGISCCVWILPTRWLYIAWSERSDFNQTDILNIYMDKSNWEMASHLLLKHDLLIVKSRQVRNSKRTKNIFPVIFLHRWYYILLIENIWGCVVLDLHGIFKKSPVHTVLDWTRETTFCVKYFIQA